jgi:phosphatidate cytidylyltransferase
MAQPETRWRELLKQRILTAIVALLTLGVVLFLLPSSIARLVIVALVLAGAYEWGGFLFQSSKAGRTAYAGFVALLIIALYLLLPDQNLQNAVLMVALGWWTAALVWLFFFPTAIPGLLGWLCGALILVPAWMALDFLYIQSPVVLLFTLMIVWFADIGAYFAGRTFGRVKLAPAISPGKTWEGVLGGLLAVCVLAAAASFYFDARPGVLVPLCIAIAMLSVVGDLTVSMFKRSAGIKDSGTLFPGHGGVLDRIDSLTAAAPLFALGISWTGLR